MYVGLSELMSGRGGNSYSEQELKAAIFLTVSASTTFVLT